jgi:CHAT domain-containing protein
VDENQTRAARALYDAIIAPLRPALEAVRALLIAPEAELHLMPFAALLDPEHQPLLSRYLITYLTSGRDLLSSGQASAAKRAPAIFADPDFGPRPGSVPERPTLHFEPRAGMAAEAADLRELLPSAALFTGTRATEDRVRAQHGPVLLHFATHAFVRGDAPPPGMDARSPRARRSIYLESSDPPAIDDAPMRRAGLALAGANQALESTGDGILTALEIAQLDLLGTELVTLGACDTGLGEIRRSEGIHGLRRAFLLAGARAVVSSMWKVSDAATRTLMTAFYRRLLTSMPRGEALRQAQIELLRVAATAHPFFWAAFTLSGDRGSLLLR